MYSFIKHLIYNKLFVSFFHSFLSRVIYFTSLKIFFIFFFKLSSIVLFHNSIVFGAFYYTLSTLWVPNFSWHAGTRSISVNVPSILNVFFQCILVPKQCLGLLYWHHSRFCLFLLLPWLTEVFCFCKIHLFLQKTPGFTSMVYFYLSWAFLFIN